MVFNIRPNYVIMSYMHVFSIFNGDVITPNLGNYQTDMTTSSTAFNQSKLLNYFQKIIITNNNWCIYNILSLPR